MAAVILLITPEYLPFALSVRETYRGYHPHGNDQLEMFSWIPRLLAVSIVLAAGLIPVLERHVRTAVGEVLDTPFALAARAHGIGRTRVLYRHVLPAALHPLIALLGLSLGTLLSASLLVEVLVGWPGIVPLFLQAVLARDFAIVLGVVMVSAAMLIAGNLAADLMLYRADPRIRIP